MKTRLFAVALALSTLLLGGCLDAEEMEVRVFREGGDPAVVIVDYRNIYSGETDPEKVQRDFDSLSQSWRGKPEKPQEGWEIKGRELLIQDGKIVGRQIAIVKDLFRSPDQDDFSISPDGKSVRFKTGADDESRIETNGRVIQQDGKRYVEWPRDAIEMRFRMISKVGKAYAVSQPILLKKVTEAIAAGARQGDQR